MADHDESEKGIPTGEVESASEGKGPDASEKENVVAADARRTRSLEAPEFIRNLTAEQRAAMEAKLRWKIDLRLMPMIILSKFEFRSDLSVAYCLDPWASWDAFPPSLGFSPDIPRLGCLSLSSTNTDSKFQCIS